MKPIMNLKAPAAIWLWLIAWIPAAGQAELKTDFYLGGGGEYNIFKSPETLYSNVAEEYWDRDSLIISDFLIDAEYDIDFTKEKKDRYRLRTGSDLWYRHYLNNKQLSQSRLNAYGEFKIMPARVIHLGLYYNLRWSDRVGTSVTGDLLMRSFKYLGNEGMFYIDILPGENVTMRLLSNYEYKIYYDEGTLDPLDHRNLEVGYSFIAAPGKRSELELNVSALDRQYSYYHALDAGGSYDRSHPLRHFRYYSAELGFNWKPFRGFRINPKFEAKRRFDLYEDYYSYLSYGGGMRIRYMSKKFYISLYGDYNLVNYDIRPAFTSQPEDPMLVYTYFDYALTVKYELSDRWELSLALDSDNRDSNSDLDYFKTRRGYQNYEAILGIQYTLPVKEWK
jgi:hypothetical protein